ncbi:hypothetical protein AB0I72_13315 [Nocardiopsis sp. NPDC049922]|uniref:hypothetical protein n=1 Tax=Nocardiopsis sp. NPDC049922 TaxID=3155157 RepID=UPI0034041497
MASVLTASGVVVGATVDMRGAEAQPATPHASSTWARLTLDPAVYGAGAVSGTRGVVEVSGADDSAEWNTATAPASEIAPNVPSATGTAAVATTLDPSTARARADGAFTELSVPEPVGTSGPAQVIVNEGTPGTGGLTTVLDVATWQNSVTCAFPHDPIFLTSAVAATVFGQSVPVSQASQTTALDFAGDYGPGTSGVRVLVTTQQIQEAVGSRGHAELDLSATAQTLDESGEPVGSTVTLFDLVLGDVTMDCAPLDPSPSPEPSPDPTPTPEPTPNPSPTPEPYDFHRLSHEEGQTAFDSERTGGAFDIHGDAIIEEGGVSDRLALTGSGIAAMVIAGLVVVATGVTALIAARRRRA